MNKSLLVTALTAATVAISGSTLAQNINQSQSGSGNSQSISIGNVDGKAPAKKKSKKVDSTQNDPSTGNSQTVNADSGGNISQNQSGNNNKQSIEVGGNVNGGKAPSVTQSQTGSNRKQSIVVDGKKVEKKQE